MKQETEKHILLHDLAHPILGSAWITRSISPTSNTMTQDSPSPPTSSSGASTTEVICTDCVVCGDKSSGKHYGQFSCEGCKSFFKRSIRRSLNYSCRGAKDCSVDVHNRNQCQFCRLKKCIKMGMRKEAVQRGRLPSFAHPYPQPIIFPHSFLSHSLSPYLSPLISTLVRAEPIPRMFNTGTSNISSLDAIFEFGAQLLFSIVEWVRQLPFFVDLITSDQTTLLQSSWAQLFILYATQSGVQRCNSMAFTAKSPLTTISDVDTVTENCRLFQEHVGRIQSLHLDVAEMSCMKATLLFNPGMSYSLTNCHITARQKSIHPSRCDTPFIQEQIKIETIQEKIQGSLDDYCRSQKAHQPGRFGRILLRLSSLHTVTSHNIEQLFFSKLVGQKSVECILRDIFTQSALVPKVWPYSIDPNQLF